VAEAEDITLEEAMERKEKQFLMEKYASMLLHELELEDDDSEELDEQIVKSLLVARGYVSRDLSRQIAALFPSRTGGLTGCVSNWLLGLNFPTAGQYQKMREALSDGFLRREYDDLRRPFNLTDRDQWGDVWRFDIEKARQHPAQKPAALIG